MVTFASQMPNAERKTAVLLPVMRTCAALRAGASARDEYGILQLGHCGAASICAAGKCCGERPQSSRSIIRINNASKSRV